MRPPGPCRNCCPCAFRRCPSSRARGSSRSYRQRCARPRQSSSTAGSARAAGWQSVAGGIHCAGWCTNRLAGSRPGRRYPPANRIFRVGCFHPGCCPLQRHRSPCCWCRRPASYRCFRSLPMPRRPVPPMLPFSCRSPASKSVVHSKRARNGFQARWLRFRIFALRCGHGLPDSRTRLGALSTLKRSC